MSGGVDSTVAVKLLKNRGFRVSGATMRLLPDDDIRVERTHALAEKLGIEFFVFDFVDEFQNEIVDYFAKAYIDGITPNPCVLCNQKFKFGRFLDKALELGFDYIATGHYASVLENNGEYELRKSENLKKDQSYFIYGLTQRELSHVIFPLEGLQKEETREIAETLGLDNAHQKDSQDICFVETGMYMKIVEEYANKNGIKIQPGKFVNTDGKILGENPGIEKYTIGQRKGVGITLGEKPMYVVAKDNEKHIVVMGEDDKLYSKTMTVKNVSFVNEKYKKIARAEIKPRYSKMPAPGTLEYNEKENIVTITFDEPVRAITPGQFAVFYEGNVVLGGGEII